MEANVSSISQLLRDKEEKLLRIMNPNVLLLSHLKKRNGLDVPTEQAIDAEGSNYKRNSLLLQWLKQSPSRDAYDLFLGALRKDEQQHVANYIDGTSGEN